MECHFILRLYSPFKDATIMYFIPDYVLLIKDNDGEEMTEKC